MAEAPISLCQYSTWRWVNIETGEVRPFNCGCWRCPTHIGSLAWALAKRIAWARPERMITITRIPTERSRACLAFSHLVQTIRREGWTFEYLRVLEVGAGGGYHYHLAQRGSYIPQRWLSKACEGNGLGRVVDIRACKGRGASWYMAKYITKEAVPIGWRKVAQSRGWPRMPRREPGPGWVLLKGRGGIPYNEGRYRDYEDFQPYTVSPMWDVGGGGAPGEGVAPGVH